MPQPPLPQKAATRVEDLDPLILPVADIDEILMRDLRIQSDAPYQ
jgi:hypothetical protein